MCVSGGECVRVCVQGVCVICTAVAPAHHLGPRGSSAPWVVWHTHTGLCVCVCVCMCVQVVVWQLRQIQIALWAGPQPNPNPHPLLQCTTFQYLTTTLHRLR